MTASSGSRWSVQEWRVHPAPASTSVPCTWLTSTTPSSGPPPASSALWRTVSSMFGRLKDAATIFGSTSPRHLTMLAFTWGVALACGAGWRRWQVRRAAQSGRRVRGARMGRSAAPTKDVATATGGLRLARDHLQATTTGGTIGSCRLIPPTVSAATGTPGKSVLSDASCRYAGLTHATTPAGWLGCGHVCRRNRLQAGGQRSSDLFEAMPGHTRCKDADRPCINYE